MLILIAGLIGVLIFLVFNLVLGDKEKSSKSVKARVQEFRRPNAPEDIVRYESEKLDRPLYERLFAPLFRGAVAIVTAIAPGRLYALAIEKKMRAGNFYRWSVGSFVFIWLLSAVGMTVAAGYFTFSVKHMPFFNSLILTIAAFGLGVAMPLVILNSFISKRQAMMLRQLPEMLDLICVSVQAGLSFDGSLSKVVEKMKGPLIDECRKMLQEVKMGMTRRQALVNLANRCQVQEISLFTAAIIQSDRLGVAMSKTLLIQSTNMRERRRQQVKELALKAPIKMIFPLAIFIFPALFIVVLIPSVITIIASFNK